MTQKEQEIVLTLLRLAERKLAENPFSTASTALIEEALTLLRGVRITVSYEPKQLLPNENKKHEDTN